MTAEPASQARTWLTYYSRFTKLGTPNKAEHEDKPPSECTTQHTVSMTSMSLSLEKVISVSPDSRYTFFSSYKQLRFRKPIMDLGPKIGNI